MLSSATLECKLTGTEKLLSGRRVHCNVSVSCFENSYAEKHVLFLRQGLESQGGALFYKF